MNNKPCKLTFEGNRYQVHSTGTVYQLGGSGYMDGQEVPVDEPTASKVKAEARRLRRNRNQRERNQAMRDLGLVKTPYGWE